MKIDYETAELLRDEPELLAIADALQSAGDRIDVPVPGKRPRQRRIRVAAVALAAVAALVVVLVAPWEGRGPSFVDKALAAVGDAPVLHVVVRYSYGERVDLHSGHTVPIERDVELWYDGTEHVYRAVTRIDGHVVSSQSGTGDLGTEPFFLSNLYRQALEDGKVHRVGEAVVLGHRAIVVEGGRLPRGAMRAYLDAETYRILRLQFILAGRVAYQMDVLRFETVGRQQAHLPKPQPGPVPQQPGVSHSGGLSYGDESISPAEARKAFAEPAPWPGASVDGHPLSAIHVEDVTDTTEGETVRGRKLRFEYGSEPGSDPFLAVEDAPASSPLWSAESVHAPQPGYVDLTTGETSSNGHDERTQWTGVMQQDGFVVQLTSWSRATLLAAARALQPLP
jgi:hypothetical protein